MKKNDPRLIVTLEAASITAERAWNRPDNQDRCLPASESVLDISSRESTPAPEQHGSRIQLTFDDKPKNLEKGFVFGSDPQICDFFLGERGAGFSRRHFRISFSERGEVIFENTSREVAQVDYNGEDPPVRNHFTWILFDKYKHIVVTMKDEEEEKEDGLVFKVEWPNNKSCKAEYEAHRDAYLEERRNAFPALGQLGMKSQLTTARNTAQHSPGRHPQHSPRQHSPGQQPIYLMEEELGRGSFGTVHTAVDVSTGVVYAAKKFHSGNWKQEVDILKSVSHVSVIIDPTIDPCLTCRKGAHCKIRIFLGGAETSAGDGISTSWKLGLSRLHHRRTEPSNPLPRTAGSRLPAFSFSASSASGHQARKYPRSVPNSLPYQACRFWIGKARFRLENFLRN